jgi:hypothetical protein
VLRSGVLRLKNFGLGLDFKIWILLEEAKYASHIIKGGKVARSPSLVIDSPSTG